MSTEHHGDYCAVKGKMKLSRSQAHEMAGRLGMDKYKCPECGGWHMQSRGSRKKGKARWTDKAFRKRPFRFRPRA